MQTRHKFRFIFLYMRKEKRNDRIRWTIIQHTVLPLSQQNILSLIYFPENCFFSEICLFL